MLYFNRNGVWFTIPIAKDAVYSRELLEKQIHNSLLALQNLKDRSADLDQMRFEKYGEYKIKSVFGRDDILISPTTIQKGKMRKIEREETVYTYVLLVELWKAGGTSPGGFAIFEPSENNTLKFAGWTNSTTDNVKDPPGIIGQATTRLKWCNQPGVVEQVVRVDQGVTAYVGDSEIEEVTAVYGSNSNWTFEGIDHSQTWVSVDPGPPDPAYCGYTWAIPASQGGPGGGDFEDIRHLFFGHETSSTPPLLIDWWPLEFNQKLVMNQRYNDEGGCTRYADYWSSAWDTITQDGIAAALGELLLPGTLSAYLVTTDVSKRVWGLCWGTTTYYYEDISASDEFPYTAYVTKPYSVSSLISDMARYYLDDPGVYVKDRWQEFFIQGFKGYFGSNIYHTEGRRFTKRVAVNEASRFVAEVYPRDPLTANQLEVLLGNEASTGDWVYNSYGGYWYAQDGDTEYDLGALFVKCGLNDNFIFNEEGTTDLYWTGYFGDYGIFTKLNTGIDKDGNVNGETVDPIYANSMWVAKYSYTYTGEVRGIIYGMELDGVYYKTDELPWQDGWSGTANIPGLENATDSDGALIKARAKVRIGVKKITVKEEIEVEDL